MLLAERPDTSIIWKRIPCAPEYEISNYGTVRRDGRVKKPWIHQSTGELWIQLWRGQIKKPIDKPVKQLIDEAFNPTIPAGRKPPKRKKSKKVDKAVEGRRDAWTESRSHYRNAGVYIPNDGNHREPGKFKVLRNYATTVIDGWLDRGDFEPHEVYAIGICRDHWLALDQADNRRGRRGAVAVPTRRYMARLNKLGALASRVPLWKWRIFENVVRWNEPTGVPGSQVSKITPASVSAAKRIVAEVARSIM